MKIDVTPFSIEDASALNRLVPPRTRLITRSDLNARLDAAASARLVALVAPAGWGKTSAVTGWISSQPSPVAWFSCCVEDRTLTTVARLIVLAIQRIQPDFGATILARLRNARPASAEDLAQAVVASMYRELADELIIVLDDFHLIPDPASRRFVRKLIDDAPTGIRWIITSRNTLEWPLTRMAVGGDYVELNQSDLAFSRDEVLDLLGRSADDASDLGDILERLEGWPAGVRLLQLWLDGRRSRGDVSDPPADIPRSIGMFLSEEVIDAQPEDLRTFLEESSVMTWMSPEYIDAVLGRSDSGELLDRIDRANLFLVPMSESRNMYRYHTLFRDVLLRRMEATRPERLRQIRIAFAEHLRHDGSGQEALEQYIAIQDWERAADVLDAFAMSMIIDHGETLTFLTSVEFLPEHILHSHPRLRMLYAWALVLAGRLDESERIVDELERSTRSDPDVSPDDLASIRSRIAAYRGDHRATIEYSRRALGDLDSNHAWFKADALLSLGFAWRALGQSYKAEDVFRCARELGAAGGSAHALCWGARYQAITLVTQGRYREAESMVQESLRSAAKSGWTRHPAYSALLVSRADFAIERFDLDAARSDLDAAMRLALINGDTKILMNVHGALADLSYLEGRQEQSTWHGERQVELINSPGERARLAWMHLRQGRMDDVRRWMRQYESELAAGVDDLSYESAEVVYFRVMIALGQLDDVQPLLETRLKASIENGRFGAGGELTTRLLMAHVRALRGDLSGAVQTATPALEISAREEAHYTVVVEGPALLPVLYQCRQRSESDAVRAHLDRVIRMLETLFPATPMTESTSTLTDREQEVFALLARGKTNKEIAADLYVSVGTVKAHLNHIYAKLGVRNRAEAVSVSAAP